MKITKEEFKKEYDNVIKAGEKYITLRDQLQNRIQNDYPDNENDFYNDVVNDEQFNQLLIRAEKLVDDFNK